jgi:2'-5' RNA ligase
MKKKYFFLIYLNDSVKQILDGMRLIADPMQKNNSHITVKGPYKTAQRKKLVDDNKLIKGKDVKVVGAGKFFEANQNTVFFECEDNPELFEIWNGKEEKSYKEFHPHITIYDGENRNFADRLFNIIDAHSIAFSFTVEKLTLYSSLDKNRDFFHLKRQTDYQFLSRMVEFDINQDNIDTLSDEQRLDIIDKLCELLATNKNSLSGFQFINHSISSLPMKHSHI